MAALVVGVFESKRSALEAAQAFREAGLGRNAVAVVAGDEVVAEGVSGLARHLQGRRLLERNEGLLGLMLKGVVVGSVLVEAPVLVWLLWGVDASMAASLGMSVTGLRLLLGSTAWKVGALAGGFVGLAVGLGRGMEPQVLRRYEDHLARGRVVVAARVPRRRAPNARGILIESGAWEVSDEHGTFILSPGGAAGRV